MVTGNTLIELGYKPAKWFGEAIEVANKKGLQGEELILFLESSKPKPVKVLPLNSAPVSFHKNIRTESKEEEENVSSVIETMNVLMRTPTVVKGAVMPDACPTGENGQIPVGGVVVTKNAIHPSMHSADMCCSVFATNMGKTDPKLVLDAAFETTQFGAGKRKEHHGWASILTENKTLYDAITGNYFTQDYIEKAMMHLGTQGDGNHFLFVGTSEQTGDTWMVTHHGSRGFGASVYKKGMATAEKYRRKLSPNTLKRNAWIPYNEAEGELYWEAIQIVREWTKLNHSSIHQRTLNKIKVPAIDSFWNEHNSVFKDGDLFYHAKGATPLLDKFVPDSSEGRRLIPLNMSEPVLIVKGEETENNLGFAPHGAGRNISRTAHKKKKSKKTIDNIFAEETKYLDIRFYSGIVDISELPSAYKNAEAVQRQMEEYNLGKVIDKIMPYGCIMAGERPKDMPWRRSK
ncbi:RtcB family protein [Salinimicrobium sp. GXAS 041]|uniref:RtcB family protein n=1 Tax=Salinimicrobium sp. GXAS 041 TaxID=3400806 RepID=UPI003C7065CC